MREPKVGKADTICELNKNLPIQKSELLKNMADEIKQNDILSEMDS